MTKPIHLEAVELTGREPKRLNLFAGRHLGEREFDLLQAYADDRLTPLLAHAVPGIVAGLEAAMDLDDPVFRIRVGPGNAIGGDGMPVRLHYPLEQTWPQLREYSERGQDGPLADGLYFLHLDRSVELADADTDAQPCRRTEADPLRDRRLETVALLGLRFISAGASLLALPQSRAVNRLCARFVEESPFETVNGGIPLAMLKVVARTPVWFDAVSARYPAREDGPYRAFLAHAQAAMEEFSHALAAAGKSPDPALPLADQIGLDFLPATGPLPAELLRDVGGETPSPAFAPRDLQIDMIPVPADTVPAVVERELPRGWVDLVHGRGDRIRLLVAVDDPDYRPGLMDLPQPDLALESELLQRSQSAIQAWQAWKAQWLALFNGLSADQIKGVRAPDLPANEGAILAGLTARVCVDQVVSTRKAALARNEALPHPYSDWEARPRLGFQNVELLVTPTPGLHKQRLDLAAGIDALEGELEENFQLLNELNDFLGLQRQHLDSITVSFSALAGGVPGDGSGMNLIRWSKYAEFQPKLKIE